MIRAPQCWIKPSSVPPAMVAVLCLFLSSCTGQPDRVPRTATADSARVVASGQPAAAQTAATPASDSATSTQPARQETPAPNIRIDSAAAQPWIERRDSMFVLVLSPAMWRAFRDSFPNGQPLQPSELTAVSGHPDEAVFAVVGDLDGDGSRDAMFMSRLGERPGENPSRAPYAAKVAILTRAGTPLAYEAGTAAVVGESTPAYLRGYEPAEWQDEERRPLGRLNFAVREWVGTEATLLYYRDGKFHESVGAAVVPPGTEAGGDAPTPLNEDSLAMVDDPPRPLRYIQPSSIAALPEAVRAELTRRRCEIVYDGKEPAIVRGAFYRAGPRDDWAVRCSRVSVDDRTGTLFVFGAGRATVDTLPYVQRDTPWYQGPSAFPRGAARLESAFDVVEASRVEQLVREASNLPEDRRTAPVNDAIIAGDIEGAGMVYYWDGTRFVVITMAH